MEVGDQESGESDPEEDRQACNEDVSHRGGDPEGLKTKEDDEGESSDAGEEQQETLTVDEEDWYTCSEDEDEGKARSVGPSSKSSFHNSSRLLRKDELLDMFRAVHDGPQCREGQLTIGLVGETSRS